MERLITHMQKSNEDTLEGLFPRTLQLYIYALLNTL